MTVRVDRGSLSCAGREETRGASVVHHCVAALPSLSFHSPPVVSATPLGGYRSWAYAKAMAAHGVFVTVLWCMTDGTKAP